MTTPTLVRPTAERLLPAYADRPVALGDHLAEHGPLPALAPGQLVDVLAAAGLTGRGGAGFPTWRKLKAVADSAGSAGRPVVVGNGAEGEPAGGKDARLLAVRPNLVLDGLQLAAAAVGAREAYLYVGAPRLVPPLRSLAQERRRAGVDRIPVEVLPAGSGFLAGEESAVASRLSGGAAVPRAKPPRVFERGVRGRPTLVQNVETLAHVGLIARYGAGWFRQLGTTDEPGTLLVTVTGAVHRPGVLEVPYGIALADVLNQAGGAAEPLSAVLLGGYHGGWVSRSEIAAARLSRPALAALDTMVGAGVVVALPAARCGLAETAGVLDFLAGESAGQCGPCLNGLPRLAQLMSSLSARGRDPRVVAELRRVAGLVAGRGACHHPDGSVRFLRSGLRVFADEVDRHLAGRCAATSRTPVLPLPDRGAVR